MGYPVGSDWRVQTWSCVETGGTQWGPNEGFKLGAVLECKLPVGSKREAILTLIESTYYCRVQADVLTESQLFGRPVSNLKLECIISRGLKKDPLDKIQGSKTNQPLHLRLNLFSVIFTFSKTWEEGFAAVEDPTQASSWWIQIFSPRMVPALILLQKRYSWVGLPPIYIVISVNISLRPVHTHTDKIRTQSYVAHFSSHWVKIVSITSMHGKSLFIHKSEVWKECFPFDLVFQWNEMGDNRYRNKNLAH